jgi:hypothetical protein
VVFQKAVSGIKKEYSYSQKADSLENGGENCRVRYLLRYMMENNDESGNAFYALSDRNGKTIEKAILGYFGCVKNDNKETDE